jgi:hypothetical protein
MLAKDVSAYFQWNYATRLAANVGVMLLLITALPDIYRSASIGQRRRLWYLVIFILAANVTIALLQGFYDLNFMAVGSGSAVSVGRAAALFEDSGASTVIFAAALSFAIGKLLISPAPLHFVVVILIAIAGYQTGGRTFFVSSFVGSLAAALIFLWGIILHRRRLWSQRIVLTSLVVLALLAFIFSKIPPSVIAVFSRFYTGMSAGDNFMEILANNLWETDRVRATSLRVMSLAAKDHYWDGTGFGTYQSYFREYFPEVVRIWSQGYDWVDLPSALYAMVPAELGVINSYLILIFIAFWAVARISCLFTKDILPVMAAIVSVLCSFWFGVHLIFQSFVVGFGVLIAAIEFTAVDSSGRRRMFVVAIPLIIGLAIAVTIKILGASRQVEYRSDILYAPQMPVPINAPISPRGRSGQWLASGAEIFYPGKPVSIFIEHPENLYPLTVIWTIRGSDGQKLGGGESKIDKLDAINGGVDLRIGDDQSLNCPEEFNTKDYCSLQVSTKPSWKWGRDTLGWFYVKE